MEMGEERPVGTGVVVEFWRDAERGVGEEGSFVPKLWSSREPPMSWDWLAAAMFFCFDFSSAAVHGRTLTEKRALLVVFH
jgi:hypothetical protein